MNFKLWLEQFNLILRCSRLPYYLYCLRSHALNQIKLLQPYGKAARVQERDEPRHTMRARAISQRRRNLKGERYSANHLVEKNK